MNKNENVAEQFDISFKSDNITDFITDISDVAFSNFIQAGNFGSLPIFGLFASGVRILHDWSTYRLAKKIYHFLFETKDLTTDDKEAFLEELRTESKDNGSEVLLLVIHRIDNINKIHILANLVKHRVKGDISIKTFLRLTGILERISCADFDAIDKYLVDRYEPIETDSLYSSGILYESIIDTNIIPKFKLNTLGIEFLKYGLDFDIDESKLPNQTKLITGYARLA